MVINEVELRIIAESSPRALVKVTRTLVYEGQAGEVRRTLEASKAQPDRPYSPGPNFSVTDVKRVIELPPAPELEDTSLETDPEPAGSGTV